MPTPDRPAPSLVTILSMLSPLPYETPLYYLTNYSVDRSLHAKFLPNLLHNFREEKCGLTATSQVWVNLQTLCDKNKNKGIILINELLNLMYFSQFKVLYFHMKSMDNSFNNKYQWSHVYSLIECKTHNDWVSGFLQENDVNHTHIHLALSLRKSKATPVIPLYAFMVQKGTTL